LHLLYVPSVLLRSQQIHSRYATLPLLWPISACLLTVVVLTAGLLAADRLGHVMPQAQVASTWLSQTSLLQWGALLQPPASTGYGHDDSRLGGTLNMDHTPVFLAVSPRTGHYWRGESKSVYDGRGWYALPGKQQVQLGEPLPGASLHPAAATNESSTYVYWLQETVRESSRIPLFTDGAPSAVNV